MGAVLPDFFFAAAGGGPWRRARVLALTLAALLAGGPAPVAAQAAAGAPANALQARFFALIYSGDSLYALKDGDRSLTRSLLYYTRAQKLAATANDTLLLAEAVFARGRVYDAWNKEPAKTIALFQQATDLFRRLPAQRVRYYYAWHLVAHAYDKVPDTARTVAVLRAMRRELARQPPALLRQLPFTVEMALSATEVGHYALADSLLGTLTRRAWIRNDPETYDYLSHYYLVQSRLDVFWRHRRPPLYLDSLAGAYRRTRPAADRFYYAHQLAHLAAAAGQYAAAYAYQSRGIDLGDSLHNHADIAQLHRALLQAQETADRQQRRAAAHSQAARTRTVWLLSSALAVISLLSFYLARQGRKARTQARRLAAVNHELGHSNQELAAASAAVAVVNQQLDDKVAQVELLNKEIQHRVKNNLHILFSLLRMQERRTDSPEVLAQLQAARLRVESIAALHNQLMRRPGEQPLADFLRTLVSAVVACLANDRQVVTQLHTDGVSLAPDTYFPLALLLNEWVTNSVKYAATPGHLLELTVRVTAQPDGSTHLLYADNGSAPALEAAARGADAGAGAAATSTATRTLAPVGLGTQIIGLLARQLGATLHSPAPYQYALHIPAPALASADGLYL